MIVSELKSQKGGRITVVLDNGLKFPLYRREIQQYGLAPGEEIPEEVWEQIKAEILIKRARKRLLYLLQRADQTEKQLRDRLARDGYPEDVADDAIAYVESYHYIDDFRYACTYLNYHQTQKSSFMLKKSLMDKGISREIIEDAFEQEYHADEFQIALRFAGKKHYDFEKDPKARQKLWQYLAGKGFGPDVISSVYESLRNGEDGSADPEGDAY